MKKLVIVPISLFLIISACSTDNRSKLSYPSHSVNSNGNSKSEEFYEDNNSPSEVMNENYLFDSAERGNTTKQNKGNTNQSIKTDDINPKNVYNTKIIKTADLKIKVEDVKKSSSKIANLVDMNGGYVSSENLQSNKNIYQTIEKNEDYKIDEYEVVTSNVIYIRVPTQNFQKVLSGLKGIALSEDYVKIDAQDVTEEYYDLETRLKTKKEVEQRYIEILRSKAKTVSEILTAEEKIRVIREEIEAVEGRLKYLQNKVSLSSIQIELYQNPIFIQETIKYKKHQETGWNFWEKAGNALSTGWNAILEFLIGLLYIWPLLIVIGVVLWILRKKLKNRKGNT
jgi:hypothetical protein